MLRVLVLLAALANLVVYAWNQGWLGSISGFGPDGDRDPARLARQVHPEALRILPPGAGASAAAAASAPEAGASSTQASAPESSLACLQAGPYSSAELDQAQGMLKAAALPAGAWAVQSSERPGVWLIYMGKYDSRDALQKKEEELKRLGLRYEELRSSPGLEPGLSLGRFDNRGKADARLAELGKNGLHTARIINITPAMQQHLLIVMQADAAQQSMLGGLKDKLPAAKGFVPCSGDRQS